MPTYEQMLTAVLMNPPDPREPLPIQNRKSTIMGVTLPFLVLSWIAVVFRFWVRFRVVREPGWDDAFVLLASLCNTAATVCVCLSVQTAGLGHHMLYQSLPKIERYLLLFYIEHSLYMTECTFIKISLLLQYLRIFKSGIMRWVCIGLLGLITAWGVSFSVVGWFPCWPVRGAWQRDIGARCWAFGLGDDVESFIGMFEAFSASNMVFDLCIFLVPLVLFGTPHLRMKNTLAMTGVFTFGGIVVGLSVWRLTGIAVTRAGTYPYLDFTWFSPMMVILSCLEIDLAIICASMPIFWPIIEKSFAAIFVSYSVEVIEERVDDRGLVYELEHLDGGEGSLKSSGTSTRELTNEEEDSEAMRKVYTVGVDPLSEEAKTAGLKTDVRSKPKPKWEL